MDRIVRSWARGHGTSGMKMSQLLISSRLMYTYGKAGT